MRSIHQHGTTFISIPRKTPEQDCGAVIYKSKSERSTENAAFSSPHMPSRAIVTEPPPGEDYAWCSLCGWRRKDRFNKNKSRKSGLDNYCQDCRSRLRENSIAEIRILDRKRNYP